MGCAPSSPTGSFLGGSFASSGNGGGVGGSARTASASGAVFERLRSVAQGLLPRKSASTSDLDRIDSDTDLLKTFKRFPPIHIDIGSGVIPSTKTQTAQTAIFCFGGPGCLKGALTQELAQEFDFITLNVEEIVFAYLPSKLGNTVGNTVEMQEALKRDPSIVTLKWILQMISARMATSTCQRFIIDIIPELTLLIKSAAFTCSNYDEVLEEFDRRHHVPFAIELAIAEEYLLLESGSTKTAKESESKAKREAAEKERLSAEMSSLLKSSCDEADKNRLERRIETYHRCADPFIRYFRKSRRVVRMDLRVPNNQELLPAVSQLLMDFGIARNSDVMRVVLFVANDNQCNEIDMDWYGLRLVRLAEICPDKEEPLVQQIRSIRKYIYRVAQPTENILVVLKGLNNTDIPRAKRINFVEHQSVYLDQFIRQPRETIVVSSGTADSSTEQLQKEAPVQKPFFGSLVNGNGGRKQPPAVNKTAPAAPKVAFPRCTMRFRAITSTRGEICLFPESMSSRLCKKIGLVFGDRLTMSETSEALSGQPSRSASRLSPGPESPSHNNIHNNQLHLSPGAISLAPPSPLPQTPFPGLVVNGTAGSGPVPPLSPFAQFLAPPAV